MKTDYAFKRLLARSLDYLFIRVLVTAVAAKYLRYNVWLGNGAADFLLTYICYLLMMVTEPCQFVAFGTTIGKALFGLYPYGQEKPDWGRAFARTWKVFVYGMGGGIFLVELYCMYRAAWKDGASRWQEADTYECRGGRGRYAAYMAVLGLCAGLDVAACRWADFPRHMGSMTAEEFAENFNDYNRYYNVIEGVILLPDGTLEKYSPEEGVYFKVTDEEELEYPSVQIQEKQGKVIGFMLEEHVEEVDFYPAHTNFMLLLTRAMLEPAQSWTRSEEYKELINILSGDEMKSFTMQLSDSGVFCERVLKNGSYISDMDWIVCDDEKSVMRYDLVYTVKLND